MLTWEALAEPWVSPRMKRADSALLVHHAGTRIIISENDSHFDEARAPVSP